LLALLGEDDCGASLGWEFSCRNNAKLNNLGEFGQLRLSKFPKLDPWCLSMGNANVMISQSNAIPLPKLPKRNQIMFLRIKNNRTAVVSQTCKI
jgi:hypothetical protein